MAAIYRWTLGYRATCGDDVLHRVSGIQGSRRGSDSGPQGGEGIGRRGKAAASGEIIKCEKYDCFD